MKIRNKDGNNSMWPRKGEGYFRTSRFGDGSHEDRSSHEETLTFR